MPNLYTDTGRVNVNPGPAIMLVHNHARVRMFHAFGNAGSVIAHLSANALSMRRIRQTKPHRRRRGPDQNPAHHRLRNVMRHK